MTSKDRVEVLETEPIHAGITDVELRAPEHPFAAQVEGVVVDRHGAPDAGAALAIGTWITLREGSCSDSRG